MTYDELFKAVMERAYEVEGLLLLSKRNDVDRKSVFNIIRAKVDDMASMLAADVDPVPCDSDKNDTTGTTEEIHLSEESNDDISNEQESPDGNLTDSTDTEATQEIDKHVESNPDLDAGNVSSDDEESPTEEQQDFEIDEDDNRTLHDSDEDCGSMMTFDYVEPEKVSIDDKSDNDSETTEDEPQVVASSESFDSTGNNSDNDNKNEDITVDKLLQRNMSRDLKHAFSINDRFRYRRELFGNSDVEMNDAINLVEAMQTFTEAEEYFYDILKWDKESDEVIDFMAIIKNHFYSK